MIIKFVSLLRDGAARRTFSLTISLSLLAVSLAASSAWPLAADADARNQYAIRVDQTTVKQGQTIPVQVEVVGQFNDDEPLPLVVLGGKRYQTFAISPADVADKEAGGATAGEAKIFRALVSIPALLKPGIYKMALADSPGQAKDIPITVVPGGFGVQRLRLPPGKDNFISSPGEEETVQKAREALSRDKLWTGNFQKPSAARTSSNFGLRRVVNGKLLPDYFHSGIDYAGGYGSPVKAAQSGKVIIAHNGWRLHGNTVAIDHGQGVVTFYIHLSKVLVKEGQAVKTGDQIGKIGATGRASGPHLHFSLYTSGNATNPIYWYNNNFR